MKSKDHVSSSMHEKRSKVRKKYTIHIYTNATYLHSSNEKGQ